jgi:hypothetical protein
MMTEYSGLHFGFYIWKNVNERRGTDIMLSDSQCLCVPEYLIDVFLSFLICKIYRRVAGCFSLIQTDMQTCRAEVTAVTNVSHSEYTCISLNGCSELWNYYSLQDFLPVL